MITALVLDDLQDPTALADQIRSAVAEMRAHNPPGFLALVEQLATKMRADLEAHLPGVPIDTVRAVAIHTSGYLNPIIVRLEPSAINVIGLTQAILMIALYGQPGD